MGMPPNQGAVARRGGSRYLSGTCTSMSRFASSPRLDADSPFDVVPFDCTSESRSAVSGARCPPALKNRRCPQLDRPETVSRALSITVIDVPWRVIRMVSTAGFLAVDW